MNDDLISRKALMEAMREIRFDNMQDVKAWIEAELLIERAPAVFDKEKVIEKMNEKYFNALDIRNRNKGTALSFSSEVRADAWEKAIEIIEKGGI